MALSQEYRLGFLASGGGTNMQAVMDGCSSKEIPARVTAVVSNISTSGALVRAREYGAPGYHMSMRTHPDPEKLDRAITDVFLDYEVQLVVLAGYLRQVGPIMLDAFPNRILNIHPALDLERFGGDGMHGQVVHQAVLDAGEAISGCTVHIANHEYDRGPIVGQESVPVLPDDTAETLAARVLVKKHQLLPRIVRDFAQYRVVTQSDHVSIIPEGQ